MNLEIKGLVGLSDEARKQVEVFNASLAGCQPAERPPIDVKNITAESLELERQSREADRLAVAQAAAVAARRRKDLLPILAADLNQSLAKANAAVDAAAADIRAELLAKRIIGAVVEREIATKFRTDHHHMVLKATVSQITTSTRTVGEMRRRSDQTIAVAADELEAVIRQNLTR